MNNLTILIKNDDIIIQLNEKKLNCKIGHAYKIDYRTSRIYINNIKNIKQIDYYQYKKYYTEDNQIYIDFKNYNKELLNVQYINSNDCDLIARILHININKDKENELFLKKIENKLNRLDDDQYCLYCKEFIGILINKNHNASRVCRNCSKNKNLDYYDKQLENCIIS